MIINIIKTLILQIQMQKKNPLVTIQELERKLDESQKDKVELKKAIEQLNKCYQTKISMLQTTIEAYQNRIEQLLQWKKNQIEKDLLCSSKFQQQNKKLLGIIGQLEKAFADERQELKEQIRIKDETIRVQKQENEELINKGVESEQKIDQLVKQHTKQIEELKNELMMIKQQMIEGSVEQQKGDGEEQGKECYEVSALKEITGNENTQKGEETRIKQLTYRSPSNYIKV